VQVDGKVYRYSSAYSSCNELITLMFDACKPSTAVRTRNRRRMSWLQLQQHSRRQLVRELHPRVASSTTRRIH
jgi:hypothetical protein